MYSCCGYKNPLVNNLYVRDWKCPVCHIKHDRGINANINILNKGTFSILKIYKYRRAHTGIYACGDRVKLKPL